MLRNEERTEVLRKFQSVKESTHMQQVRIIRKPRVTEITGLSPSTYRRLELAGEFPKRVKLSKAAVGWLESDVLAWVEARRNGGAAHA